MLVLEALLGLFFWSQLSAVVLLPSAPVSLLPALRAMEAAWQSPDAAWLDPVQAAAWSAYWRGKTGCCVDFSFRPDVVSCRGPVRMVAQKTLGGPIGLQAAFVVVACGG